MAGLVDPRAALKDLHDKRIKALQAELAATTAAADRRRLRWLIRQAKWNAVPRWWGGPAHF